MEALRRSRFSEIPDMGVGELQGDGLSGSDAPYVHKNWDALKQNRPCLGTDEYPLYTDAHLVGNATEGYGPYQFINLVPITNQRGLVQPLDDLKPITALPRITGSEAIALVRAARMYQDALWIVESEPSLAWVMLVSAVETAAHHWRSTEDTPLERLKDAKPELFAILEHTGIKDLPEQVAECIVDSIGATRKFIDFIGKFLPGPPSRRPDSARHCWDTAALRRTMRIIYGYRSDALHSGRPFPAPMCEPPRLEVPEEVPLGLAALRNDSIWFRKDTPLMLHVFEYIVRHSLLNWWGSMVTQP